MFKVRRVKTKYKYVHLFNCLLNTRFKVNNLNENNIKFNYNNNNYTFYT